MKILPYIVAGLLAGAFIAIQSILNAGLGRKVGSLGSVLVLTVVSALVVLVLIFFFPGTATLKESPGLKDWYLYVGGLLGIAILTASIVLVPRIGASATLTTLVVGQLVTALFLDHIGWLGTPRIEISLSRVIGIMLLVIGAYFIVRR
jgi:bacterial/archaeal transporter family-2 protein